VVEQFPRATRRTPGSQVPSARRLELTGCWCGSPNSIIVDRLEPTHSGAARRPSWPPRPRSRSAQFQTHLLGVVEGACLDWAVTFELLAELAAAHPAPSRHHCGRHPVRVRRRGGPVGLLEAGKAHHCRTNPASPCSGGPTYRTIFALCYGLGVAGTVRVCGAAAGWTFDAQRHLLVVRGRQVSAKTRLVPHGPRHRRPLIARAGSPVAAPTVAVGDDAPAVQLRRAPPRAIQAPASQVVPPPGGHTRTSCPPRVFSTASAYTISGIRFAVGCLLRWYPRRVGTHRPGLPSIWQTYPGSRRPPPSTGGPTSRSPPELLAEANQPIRRLLPNRPWRGDLCDDLHPAPGSAVCSRSFVDHLITVQGAFGAGLRCAATRDNDSGCCWSSPQPTKAAESPALKHQRSSASIGFVGFLRHLEEDRGQPPPRTRNPTTRWRLHTLFDYIANRGEPRDASVSASGWPAIPMKACSSSRKPGSSNAIEIEETAWRICPR